MNTNLTKEQHQDWATFLPAISSFYISGVGKQLSGEQYFDASRIPKHVPIEGLNFLDHNTGIYHYRWGLYSAGHANLNVNVVDNGEHLIRNRIRIKDINNPQDPTDPGVLLLGDSGGFQIAKGVWEGDWRAGSGCTKADLKRKQVLTWMNTYMDYGMCLDIPTFGVTKEGTELQKKIGIATLDDAIAATKYNNDYFINNTAGKCRFLNVLQGRDHAESDRWYNEMKHFADPNYHVNHFRGWAMGGNNKADIYLVIKRLIDIVHDGLLQEGKQDWIHYLGLSQLEWAAMFTTLQRALRKYYNPKVCISFDCASPFLAAAKGLAYYETTLNHNEKWTYRMAKTIEDKAKAGDTRKLSKALIDDGIYPVFSDSPITDSLTVGDLCYRGQGFLGQHGKETKTSWDTLSYTLLQSHNTWCHIDAVQEALRRYGNGTLAAKATSSFGNGLFETEINTNSIPAALITDKGEFAKIVEDIFSQKNRQDAITMLESYKSVLYKIRGQHNMNTKHKVTEDHWNSLVDEDSYDEAIIDV